jgi:hypothetical protein
MLFEPPFDVLDQLRGAPEVEPDPSTRGAVTTNSQPPGHQRKAVIMRAEPRHQQNTTSHPLAAVHLLPDAVAQ